jgi:hypothetical protein
MKRALLLLFILLMSGCRLSSPTKYSEKASQVVYATKDSIDAARIDLAKEYADQSVRLITPPQERIVITAIQKPSKDGKSKSRVVIIPPELGNQEVITVGSEEYKQLKQIVVIADQLKIDYKNLQEAKEAVDEELRKERERVTQLETDLTQAQKNIKELSGDLWKRNCIILILGGIIVLYIYAKIKGLFLLPI